MRPHDDPDRAEEVRRRIRAARATARAAMEDRREEVRADLERRIRELDDGRPDAA